MPRNRAGNIDTSRARDRLDYACAALQALRGAGSFREFRKSWTEFLLHANGVYTQLEQAAKVTPQARQWFGAKKRERKDDELLQYLRQARHSDEHTLDEVSRYEPGFIGVGESGSGHIEGLVLSTLPSGELEILAPDGMPVPIKSVRPRITLRPVTGKGNIVYLPPMSRRGKSLADISPAAIATLAVEALDQLLSEAEERFS